MAKRYIVQKRELKERHGKKPHLMGPYRTVYSDIHPPFDLSDKEKIEASLLRTYGEGRYQVKSVGKDEGEKKSKITVHFTGDVEKYKSRARTWTKEERVKAVHWKKRKIKDVAFVVTAFFILFLVAFWLFLAALGSGMDSSLVVVSVLAVAAVFVGAVFFIDMMFFESE